MRDISASWALDWASVEIYRHCVLPRYYCVFHFVLVALISFWWVYHAVSQKCHASVDGVCLQLVKARGGAVCKSRPHVENSGTHSTFIALLDITKYSFTLQVSLCWSFNWSRYQELRNEDLVKAPHLPRWFRLWERGHQGEANPTNTYPKLASLVLHRVMV
jgi:hypothetical protein